MPKPLKTLPVLLSVLVTLGATAPPVSAQERPVLVPQSGHGSAVAGMEFSRDGAFLLSWEAMGNTAIVWDVTTAKQFRTLPLPWAPLSGDLRRTAEGNPVAYLYFGDGLRSYDLRTGEPGDSTILPSGGLVEEWATGGPTGRVFARAYNTFQTEGYFLFGVVAVQGPDLNTVLLGTGYRGGPYGPYMAVSPDGTLLAVAGSGVEDGQADAAGIDGLDAIGFWDLQTGELRGQIPIPGDSINAVAFHPSGEILLVGRDDEAIELYSVPDGRLLQRVDSRLGVLIGLAVSRRGDRVAAAQVLQGTALWAMEGDGEEARLTAEPVAMWPGGQNLAFSWDGTTLVEAPGSFDQTFGAPLHLVDAVAGRSLRTLANRVRPVRYIAAGQGGLLATSGDDGVLRVWDGLAGEPFKTFPQGTGGPVAVHPGRPLVASGSFSATWAEQQSDPDVPPYGVRLLDLAGADTARTLRVFNGAVTGVAFDGDGRILAAASADSTVRIWRAPFEGPGTVLRAPAGVSDLALDPEGRWVAGSLNRYSEYTGFEGAAEGTTVVRIWRLDDTAADPVDVSVMRRTPDAISAVPDGSGILLGALDGTLRMISPDDGSELSQGQIGLPISALAMSDSSVVVGTTSGEIIRLGIDAQGIRRTVIHPGGVTRLVRRPDGTLASAGMDGTTRLWTADGDEVAAFQAVLPEALAVRDTIADWDLLTAGDDPTARQAYLRSHEGFLVTLPDGRYRASRGALDAAVMREGLHAVPLARHDLALNRPDAVVAALGGPAPLVDAYARARERRLERAGISSAAADAKGDLAATLPTLTLDRTGVPPSTSQRTLRLAVSAVAADHALERLQVRINDVPLYGDEGIDLAGRASMDTTLVVELTDGRNRMEVSIRDADGRESIPASAEVIYTGAPAAPDLYVLTFGVSDYADDRFDLKYAAKDAGDVAVGFAAQEGRYGAIHTLTLTDGEVTRDALPRARAFLEQAGIHDQVVVFFAGHGLLDADLNYWFGTHDLDFQHPGLRGLAYDDIQALVTGLASRRVLLLMDTCHSGEVDEEAVPRPTDASVTARGFPRSGVVGGGGLGLSNSYKLLNQLFFDFGAGTGATVVAAAAGVEFAFEAAEWDNGVFTYALLSGLRSMRADMDRDGAVELSELTDYVTARVSELTDGRQTPTARAQALERDYVVYARPVLSAGTTLEGRLDPGISPLVQGNAMEAWSLHGEAGKPLAVEVTTSAFTPRLVVTGPDTQISDWTFRTDDREVVVRLCVVPQQTGTYRVAVTSMDGQGAFALRVSDGEGCIPSG